MPNKITFKMFPVNRDKWLTVGLPSLSLSGSTDIFGSLALSLGVPPQVLDNLPSLASLSEEMLDHYPVLLNLLRPDLHGNLYLSLLACQIMDTNYNPQLTRQQRESDLKFLFASEGLLPRFSGGHRPQ